MLNIAGEAGPCFGTEIELVLKDEVHNTVPKIVVECCRLIEEKYSKSTEPIEDLYGKSGDHNKIQALKLRIDANDYMALRLTTVDIHTLTNVLKLFLLEMKSPLMSTDITEIFIAKPLWPHLPELQNKFRILRRLIRSLPQVRRDTVEYLFAHFNKLNKVPLQYIHPETLALYMTTPIFHNVLISPHIQYAYLLLEQSKILTCCLKLMIKYYHEIFECSESLDNNFSSGRMPPPFVPRK